MAIQKNTGDKLNLYIQLHDGVDTFPKRVFVNLYNDSFNLLASNIELPHIGNGLFMEGNEVMTSDEVVIAQFKVTDADGITLSVDHSCEEDRYEQKVEFNIPEVIIPKPFAVTVRARSVNRIRIEVRDE